MRLLFGKKDFLKASINFSGYCFFSVKVTMNRSVLLGRMFASRLMGRCILVDIDDFKIIAFFRSSSKRLRLWACPVADVGHASGAVEAVRYTICTSTEEIQPVAGGSGGVCRRHLWICKMKLTFFSLSLFVISIKFLRSILQYFLHKKRDGNGEKFLFTIPQFDPWVKFL